MRYLKRMCLSLVVPLTLPLHERHGQKLLRQRMPHCLLHLFSRCVVSCRGNATRLERKAGAELIFARNLVD